MVKKLLLLTTVFLFLVEPVHALERGLENIKPILEKVSEIHRQIVTVNHKAKRVENCVQNAKDPLICFEYLEDYEKSAKSLAIRITKLTNYVEMIWGKQLKRSLTFGADCQKILEKWNILYEKYETLKGSGNADQITLYMLESKIRVLKAKYKLCLLSRKQPREKLLLGILADLSTYLEKLSIQNEKLVNLVIGKGFIQNGPDIYVPGEGQNGNNDDGGLKPPGYSGG